MIEHLRELIDAGIASFKIEGRAKSPYYVGVIANAYRAALDAAMQSGLQQIELYCELGRLVSNRPEKGAAIAAAAYLQKQYPGGNFPPAPQPLSLF